MMARRACALGAAVMLVAAGALRPARAQLPTFRAATDAVAVDVSVRRQGRPVTNLALADFTLRDNGVPQTLTALSYEKNPIDVTVVLDVSESVTGAVLNQLQRAVLELRGDLATDDRLKIVTFNMRVRRIFDFSDPASGDTAAFASVRAFGTSGIFDALTVALAAKADADRRQLIVLFSDGFETGSVTDAATLIDVARRTTPTVTAVIASRTPFTSPLIGSGAGSLAGVYTELTRTTGGTVVNLIGSDNIGGALRRVLGEFRSSYVLHFTPSGVAREGVHALDVAVQRSGVDVRARKEYAWK